MNYFSVLRGVGNEAALMFMLTRKAIDGDEMFAAILSGVKSI